ncbi:MAG: amidohydrolase family protein [Armatimonadota bacterium]|nr:amidohydrolase family protein [Armatimonadota bacterium]MDR7448039.1 amidohydrolase family protein [Armatimonadota bacterium]MDR7459588.1 amidohydrolase family protein [Armatimonadota bacterium]MDR7478633.1 amidohydrolase family protein [Armatimonadota bacterium]MDR7488028.1 amidohydrolase family protein [Armatimonadota bacterium]
MAHCPKTFLKLAAGIAPVVRMRRAGVTVALGSDGAASNNTLDLLEQMRLAVLLQKHQGEDATALPVAEALALVYATRASDVHTVVVDGRVVVEDGRIRTLDREDVLRQVETRAQRLARREGRRPHQTYQA